MAAVQNKPTDYKTTVFISYSRRDTDFVIPLTEQLRENNIKVLRDADDILPAEEWRERLKNMIVQADQVIFALSPSSIESEECAWEVEIAEAFNKRMIPIVIKDLGELEPAKSLSKLNYIFFTPPMDEAAALEKLQTALMVDIAWLREHTRLSEMAHHWNQQGSGSDLMLRGKALEAAEQWLVSPQAAEGAKPTLLQQQFIHSSRKKETNRTRRNIGVLGGLLIVALASCVFAWMQYGRAVNSEERVIRTTSIASWQQLEEPKPACVKMREYTGEAGVRALYCFARDILSYRSIETLFGEPVFLSGPHSNGYLYVQKQTFGHYNPAFVDWVKDKLVPEANDQAYIASTQPLYDKHLKNLMRAFYRTYVQFTHYPEPFMHERQLLSDITEGRREAIYMGARWQDNTMRELIGLDGYAEGLNWGNLSVALRFWQRRSLDGTADNFFQLMDHVISTYDPQWHMTTPKAKGPLPPATERTTWTHRMLPNSGSPVVILNPDVFGGVLE